MEDRSRQRCLNCNQLYESSSRNRRRQKYCTRAACRKASKYASHQNWIRSPKGKDYFSGEYNVSRVRMWRQMNPGYWRRHSRRRDALQDFLLPLQLLHPANRKPTASERALQDILNSYRLILIGIIAQLPNHTEKDINEETYLRLILAGEKVSAKVSNKNGERRRG